MNYPRIPFRRKKFRFYGIDINEIQFLMDKFSSHTSKSTTAYLAKKESQTVINVIQIEKKSVNSLDTSFLFYTWFFKASITKALLKRLRKAEQTAVGKNSHNCTKDKSKIMEILSQNIYQELKLSNRVKLSQKI